jgi:hypothetical protein
MALHMALHIHACAYCLQLGQMPVLEQLHNAWASCHNHTSTAACHAVCLCFLVETFVLCSLSQGAVLTTERPGRRAGSWQHC